MLLEVPYPYVRRNESVVVCKCKRLDAAEVRHDLEMVKAGLSSKRRNPYTLLAYDSLNWQYLEPSVTGTVDVWVEMHIHWTIPPGVVHTNHSQVARVNPRTGYTPGCEAEWIPIQVECLRVYRAHVWVADKVFTCQCGMQASIKAVDARWVEHHGYWMCGPCRDQLEDRGHEPDWDPL